MREVVLNDYEVERNKPLPSLNHALVQSRLIVALSVRYADRYNIASELSLDLFDWPSVPDVSIFPFAPLNLREDVVAVTEPPLGVVEIISPTQSLNSLVEKAGLYFAHGVRSVWLVLLPLGSVVVFSAPERHQTFEARETLVDDVLDIRLELGAVFS
ncbi:MAG: Uma2 family endonuclease [Saprospiraceae bacterium]|nr:Uma2 family endonuclease [Saprospiraceae bacterium]